LKASPNIIRVIKSRRITGQGMQHAWDREMYRRFWLENLNGRDNLEDLGIEWKIILE
jgi:hypothetical protein